MKLISYLALPVTVIVTLLLVRVLGLSVPVQMTTYSGGASELSVVGQGKVEVVPDLAYVDVGVTADGATAAEAQEAITKVNNSIVTKMAEYGIVKADIETQNYNVYPNYDYANGQKIIGYRGSTVLSIKIKEASQVGEIAQAATLAGANEIQNTRFVIDKPESYRELAREKAIANAKEQAQKLAGQLGIKLGRVVNVVESSADAPGPMPFYAAKADLSMGAGGGGATANLQAGSQEVQSVVTLYFEKK